MDKEGRKRLLKLASEMERCSKGRVLHVPKDGTVGFDMSVVVSTPTVTGKDRGCGTAACAIGFAGLHPWFQSRGLRWNGSCLLVNRRRVGWYEEAAAKFFSITIGEGEHLFQDRGLDETPKQVAKRIRAFVKSAPREE